MIISYDITADSATPALRDLAKNVEPRRIGEAIAPALVQLVQDNYVKQGTNKRGFPSTHFWGRAVRATRANVDDRGVDVITDQIGVQQRLKGGKIEAVHAKNLAIANTPETYGHSPRDFNLKYVQFGRGQNAPKALVAIRATATNVEPKKRGKGFRAISQEIGRVVMFWLKKFVMQEADPNVLPTDAQFYATIETAVDPLKPKPSAPTTEPK